MVICHHLNSNQVKVTGHRIREAEAVDLAAAAVVLAAVAVVSAAVAVDLAAAAVDSVAAAAVVDLDNGHPHRNTVHLSRAAKEAKAVSGHLRRNTDLLSRAVKEAKEANDHLHLNMALRPHRNTVLRQLAAAVAAAAVSVRELVGH